MSDIRTRRLVWMLVMILVFFLAAAVTAWLWNSIIPWVIGFPPITYWQAAGILLITRILFGGIGCGRTTYYYPWPVKETERRSNAGVGMDMGQRSEYRVERGAKLNAKGNF